ncbi:hypothetical protein T01_6071 [Trichinella spiralis]|uniref:Uncharacterized protein n=1 Tax=Trichinella spiralis TaxID=6334 RepID=A0A0V1B272_TRISP|nr:hypothetical protein T01_6071 [Trichinella spiralis]
MVYGPLTRIGSTSGVAIIVLMDQVILSAQYATGKLVRDLVMEFPSRDAIELYGCKLVRLLCEVDKLEILRHEAKNQREEGKRRKELGLKRWRVQQKGAETLTLAE